MKKYVNRTMRIKELKCKVYKNGELCDAVFNVTDDVKLNEIETMNECKILEQTSLSYKTVHVRMSFNDFYKAGETRGI